MNETRKTAAAVFLVTFVAVVAVGGVVGILTDDSGGNELTEIENPQYDADRVSPDTTPGEATVQMDTTAVDSKVVVNVGGRVRERDIEPLVNAIVESGNEVSIVSQDTVRAPPGPAVARSSGDGDTSHETAGRGLAVAGSPEGDDTSLDEEITDADGLISVGVTGYASEDIEAISSFVENDGRFVMAVNPQREFAPSGAYAELYSELDTYTQPGYIYNLEENDLNYQRIFAEPAGRPMLAEDVDRVVFDTATPVQAEESDEQLRPIEGSELSVSRAQTEKSVLVRDGDVALIGDTGFMTPENTRRADNDVFVGNVAEFLVTSDRDTDSTEGSEDEPEMSGPENETASDVVTVEVGPDGRNAFEPQVTEIEPGTTVRFEWKSSGHNIVPTRQQPEDHPWEGVPEIQDEGFVHEVTFEEASAHEFVSEPYAEEGMRGVIVVGSPDPP